MSEEQSTKGQAIALAIVALLAGILIGVVGAHTFNITDETVTKVVRQESAADTPAADLRASLSTRMVEHVYLVEAAAMASYRQDPSSDVRFDALSTNTERIARNLSVLEQVSRQELENIGLARVETLEKYMGAVRQQEPEAVHRHQKQLDSLAEELAEVIARDTDISEEEVRNSLDTHITHIRELLNARIAGNHEEAHRKRVQARDHMQQLSAELAADIVAAQPGEFE